MLSGIGYALDSSKVYLLTAIDSGGNDSVGATVAADGVNIREVFEENIPSNRLSVQNIAEHGLTEQKILTAIKNTPTEKDDTLILYYSGHGAFDEQRGHYFHLQNSTTPFRSVFLNAIKAKNVRLGVLITDCCNAQSNIPKQPDNLMSVKSPATLSPLFKALFFEGEGIADITASKVGQCSFIYGTADKRGSIFTWVLCEELSAEKNAKKNWKTIFDIVAEKSNKEFIRENPEGVFVRSLGVTQRTMNPYTWSLPRITGNVTDNVTDNDIGNIVPAQRKRLGVRAENTPFADGVKIIDVLPGSAGEAAKLYIGDTIIEINGQPVRNENDYVRTVKASPATMKIKVRTANGEIKTGTVFLQ
jgi:hypothetical protein